jgi:membrane protein implicated in regulation of membrane protease activity
MGTDQVLAAAILAAIAILAVVGIWRLTQRRDRSNERDFGAGGRTSVPVGTRGVVETRLAPSGLVRPVDQPSTTPAASGAGDAPPPQG